MAQEFKKSELRSLSVVILPVLLLASIAGLAAAEDFGAERAKVLALGELTAPPEVHPAEGFASADGIKAIFYDALPWQGKPTRVFAWLGVPESAGKPMPGIVLVHGGGGTAFKEWVELWNAHGFAAICMGLEGQTDQLRPGAKQRNDWQRHEWGGPARDGIYTDSNQPLEDQWMYHAVADTVIANSLLRSMPGVNPDKVGVMGVSWGGVITSTIMGIDERFAFAIPTYGCGHLADVDNHWGAALGENATYREVWDPMQRMERAKMPTLWYSWSDDTHFPLDAQAVCYRAAPGPRMISLPYKMRHSHPAAWEPPDSYAFAESIVRDGKPWAGQKSVRVEKDEATVEFDSAKVLDRAVLISTTDTGFVGSRTWTESPAQIHAGGGVYTATATLPANTTAWFINARSGDLTVSSEYQVIK